MLDLAINYEEELVLKYRQTWLDDKYKYYHNSTYFTDMTINSDTWDGHQFVSVNKNGDVIGFIAYSICRQTHNCYGLCAINFTNDIKTFGKDLRQALTDVFEKFKFNKLNFSVVIGNPIEQSYDRTIDKFGGRVVGVKKHEVKLFDNEYYDMKLYEILRSEYLCSKYKKEYIGG